MLKKVLLATALVIMVASASLATQVGVGVSDIIGNGMGVNLVLKDLPTTVTVGGIYTAENNYLITGSVVTPWFGGVGANVVINSPASTYVVNGILEREAQINNGLAVVFDANLVTYNSVAQSVGLLQGGAIGVRAYL